MATKTTKGCPQGQVSDGKGGCTTLLPKPSPKASVETAEEKAAKAAAAAEAAKKAEEARIGNLSNREFRKETKNADRVVELANRKAGKETTSRGGKILKKIGAGVTSALAATFSGLEIAEKIKDLKKEKKGGPVKTKMKVGGVKKPVLKKANTGGGIPITARAAARKVAKGKGFMDYKYPSTDAPGTGDNKGSYVKFGKDQASSPSGFKSLKGAGKSRPVRKMGGATKKKK